MSASDHGSSPTRDLHEPLVAVALALAALAILAAVATQQALVALTLTFVVATLIDAYVVRGWLGWAAGALLCLAALIWSERIGVLDTWQALALALPTMLALYAVVRCIHGVEQNGHGDPRSRRTRASIIAISAMAIAATAAGAITLGQRATRVARHARTNDELALAATMIAEKLDAVPPARTGDRLDDVSSVLSDAARLTGRSVYLFAPAGSSHKLLVGAHWDLGNEPTVGIVRSESAIPREEMSALSAYLRNPLSHFDASENWPLPVGSMPFGISLFEPPATSAETRTIARGRGVSDFENTTVLLLAPRDSLEWWSLETRTEYQRLVLAFALWTLVVLITAEATVLRLMDQRLELKAHIRANEAREAIRRDAHDRIYNRLAGVAHALEGPDADAATTRGAAFEIRSTVDYLQTILRDAKTIAQDLVTVPLAPQLVEVAESAERIWGLRVRLELEPEVTLEPDLAWDVQCLIDEALSNAGEHSGASNAVVRVEGPCDKNSEFVRFWVIDDGRWEGASLAKGSTGLKGMRNRVRLLDGAIELTTGEAGSTVAVELPVKAKYPKN